MRLIGLAALSCVAVIAYLPALGVGLLSDDYETLSGLRHASLTDVLTRHDLIPGSGSSFFRPVWMLWNWTIFQLFGDNPLPFHVASLALFALIVILVWVLARRLLGETGAWLAAFAFALYPRHAEAVVWIGSSTDLVASALALGALVWLLVGRGPRLSVAGATILAGLAALAKEAAFAVPFLAAVSLWAVRGRQPRGDEKVRWIAPLAMLAVDCVIFAVRLRLLDGIGGYSPHAVTPSRVALVYASLGVAAITPAQLEIVRHPALAIVPVVVAGLAGWAIWRMVRDNDRQRLRIVVAGAVWFCASVLPLYNSAVNLNTAEGERLLFLPSIGLVIAAAALVPSRPNLTRLARTAPLALAGVVGGALCLASAQAYVEATKIADRVVATAVQLAPDHGTLVVLSIPDAYRNADLLSSGLAAAMSRAGRGDVTVVQCLPVLVRRDDPAQITVRRLPDGVYEATSTWSAPFIFPIGSERTRDRACTYDRAASGPPGLGLRGLVSVRSPAGDVVMTYFDGHDLRRL
jgi:hypothetical protein